MSVAWDRKNLCIGRVSAANDMQPANGSDGSWDGMEPAGGTLHDSILGRLHREHQTWIRNRTNVRTRHRIERASTWRSSPMVTEVIMLT
eukprot:3832689-Rhodomonas_salina.1